MTDRDGEDQAFVDAISEWPNIDDGPPTLALASDLYRDQPQLAWEVARLLSAGIDRADLCVVVPARGGQLSGGQFMGLPVIEADTPRCLVAVGWWRQP